MRTINILILALLVVWPTVSFAGPESPNHTHTVQITMEQAGEEAKLILNKLVQKGKLENSWGQARMVDIQEKEFAKGPEWVISFHNPLISDEKQQDFYVFLSLTGKILAANYTGK